MKQDGGAGRAGAVARGGRGAGTVRLRDRASCEVPKGVFDAPWKVNSRTRAMVSDTSRRYCARRSSGNAGMPPRQRSVGPSYVLPVVSVSGCPGPQEDRDMRRYARSLPGASRSSLRRSLCRRSRGRGQLHADGCHRPSGSREDGDLGSGRTVGGAATSPSSQRKGPASWRKPALPDISQWWRGQDLSLRPSGYEPTLGRVALCRAVPDHAA